VAVHNSSVLPVLLHPVVVHFAVALLVIGPAMDTVGLLLRREALLLTGRWNIMIGAAILILAEISGLSASASLGPYSEAGTPLLNLHTALGHVCVIVWLPIALWRGLSKQLLPRHVRTLYLTLSYTGATLILAQAALGAALIFRHGVGLSSTARAIPTVQHQQAPMVIEHPTIVPGKP
jgi:uncharacterized membrane protein